MGYILRFALLSGCLAAYLPAQTTAKLKASPAALTFTYQDGDPKLPAPQTLSVSGTVGGAVTIVAGGGPWIAVTPVSGAMPVAAKVSVNPTTLAVGTFSATVTITGADGQIVTVPVDLTVKAQPSTLTANPSSLALTYTRGGAAVTPANVTLSTSGAVLSYSAAVSGGTWASVVPKSGIVFPSFSSSLTVSANPAGLAPGAYKATLTISAAQAVNKSQTITLNLTVNPGVPTVATVWPARITQGATATTVTLTGTNFYSGTLIKSGTTTLTSTYVGPEVMTAVIPASMLATPGTLALFASNPGTGGGDSQPINFTVRPTGPVIDSFGNSASYVGSAITPGEMITIFGSGLGPATLTNFTPPVPGQPIASVLSGTRILIDTTACPIIYTSDEQVAAMVPYGVTGKGSVQIVAEYNGVQSTAATIPVVPTLPGIFTTSGTGVGQAAAFNYDEQTGTYTLNAESTAAPKGSIIVLYATGQGATNPASTDGQIVSTIPSSVTPGISVQVNGLDAQVLYTGGVPGLVVGILQVNARLPSDITAGKALPVVMTISGNSSQTGVTVAVK